MTANINKPIHNVFTGVLFELGNSFIAVISNILTTVGAIANSSIITLLVWNGRATQRDHLKQLSDSQLSDIGLNRSQAIKEASKPFWHR